MEAVAYVRVVRRRWWALLACVLAGLVGGLLVGHVPDKQYRATSRSFVSVPNRTSSSQLSGAQLSAAYLATYVRLAKSRAVASEVVDTLHLPLSAAQVQGDLTAAAEPGTFLIDITATASDPARAAAIANAAGQALRDVGAKLSGATAVTSAVVDQAGVPSSASSPRPGRDLLVGLLFGLVVGVALVAALELLDRTVRTGEQAAELSGAPLLGLLPRRRGGADAARPVTRETAYDVVSEAYRALRTAVRFLDPDAPLRTIVVTSPAPGEGKTTAAAQLAIALARGGERVIVVDADLRRAGLAAYLGVDGAVGVTSVLRREVRLRDALQEWAPNLRVLAAGPLPPNPAEVTGSQAMATLLEQLSLEADVVVVDTPPALPVTDAVVLATHADGVLLVTRHGRTRRASVVESVRRIEAVGGEVAGVVVNALPPSEARDVYLEYVYAGPADAPPVPRRPRPTARPRPGRRRSPAARDTP